VGIHQFQRPISFIAAGTSTSRTSVASRKTAAARPKPIALKGTSRPAAKAAKTVTMISAAEVMVRAVPSRPCATACSLDPVLSYSSFMRDMRKTS